MHAQTGNRRVSGPHIGSLVAGLQKQLTTIAGLSARLRVERGAIENQFRFHARFQCIDQMLVNDERDHLRIFRRSSVVSDELRAAFLLQLAVDGSNVSFVRALPTGARTLALLLHFGFETADVNGDNQLDVLTANLGDSGTPGTVSILFGNVLGGFSNYSTVSIPMPTNQPAAHLLTVKAADFDGDGHADLVTSFADSRIAFFRGNGDGSFTPAADSTSPSRRS